MEPSEEQLFCCAWTRKKECLQLVKSKDAAYTNERTERHIEKKGQVVEPLLKAKLAVAVERDAPRWDCWFPINRNSRAVT